MKCRDAIEMINSYIDNRIDPMNDKLLSEHIKSCEKCRTELDFLIRYKNIIKTVKHVSLPDNFLAQLHQKIRLENTGSPIKNFISATVTFFDNLHFPLEAAGVLALAAVVFFLYKPFFSGKIQETSEYKIESPAFKAPSIKEKSNVKQKSDRMDNIVSLKNIPSGNKEAGPGNKVVQSKNDDGSFPIDNPSVRAKSEYDGEIMGEKKKSLPAEIEKSIMKREEQSYSADSIDAKGAVSERKDSPHNADAADAEKIFVQFKVSIIKKDILRSSGLYYRIKIQKSVHSSLIRKLKENFIVKEKILIENKSDYKIELFLKKNKK